MRFEKNTLYMYVYDILTRLHPQSEHDKDTSGCPSKSVSIPQCLPFPL